MKKYQRIIEIIAFLLVIAVTIGLCYDAVRFKDKANGGGMENFYDVKSDVDVIAFGSSHAQCTVNNAVLWEEYGIASYTLALSAQKPDGIYMYMKEAFRYHKPKVALIEVLTFAIDEEDSDTDVLRTALTTRLSLGNFEYILDQYRSGLIDRVSAEEILFRLPVVHSRYKELSRDDYLNEMVYNRGYRGSDVVYETALPALTDEREEFPDRSRKYIDRILELCSKNGVEPVFFIAPYAAEESDVRKLNSVIDYITEKGGVILPLLMEYESIGIDFSSDMREESHLNDTGAGKVTRALGNYVSEHFEIPDRRGQKGYDDWDRHARFLKGRADSYTLRQCDNLYDYFDELEKIKDKYMVIISMDGGYRAIENYSDKPDFAGLGIDDDAYAKGGVVVMKKGKLLFYSDGKDEYQFNRNLSNGSDLNAYKNQADDYGHLVLDWTDLSKNCDGFQITVYDEECSYLLDDVYVKVYDGVGLLRTEELD